MAKKTNYTKNGKNYYRIHRKINGKYEEFYGKTKSEAEDKYYERKKEVELGIIQSKDVTLDSLMHKWIYEIKKYDDIKPSTFESYEGTYRNYVKNSDIANLKLFNIKSIILQEHYNKLSKNGFSSSKIKKLNKLLYQFFKYTIKEGYINRNPAENITIPKLEKENIKKDEEIEYYTEKEVKQIKKALTKNKELELLLLFALGTGLRQGELLALRYSDIDYEKMQLHVNRTTKTSYVFNEDNKKERKQMFLEPKTKNSKRIVDIPSNIFNRLEKKNTDELIFTDNGKVWDARKLYRHWLYFLKENKLPIKKFHALRHTYATLLLSKGVELITVSKLLGHSSVQITEIYSHVIPSLKTNAVNKLNSIL